MLKIKASLSGDALATQIKATGDRLAKAVSIAVAGATEGVKLELRGQLVGSGGRFNRFRNAIQSRVYPKPPRFSLKAAGTVFAAGDSADRALSAFATGAVITPKRVRTLAIPLHRYRGVDGRLLGPKSSYFNGRLHFFPSHNRSGELAGVLAMRAAGKPGETRKLLRAKGRSRVAAYLGKDWIPQFLLVRSVKLPKLLSPDEALEKWVGQIPALAEAALQQLPE